MCWKTGQVEAVDVCHDLCAQYHVLVQSDDSHHHICYLDELESCTLCLIGEEQLRQLAMMDATSRSRWLSHWCRHCRGCYWT